MILSCQWYNRYSNNDVCLRILRCLSEIDRFFLHFILYHCGVSKQVSFIPLRNVEDVLFHCRGVISSFLKSACQYQLPSRRYVWHKCGTFTQKSVNKHFFLVEQIYLWIFLLSPSQKMPISFTLTRIVFFCRVQTSEKCRFVPLTCVTSSGLKWLGRR